jgi:signal transduction histidine kinase
MMGAVVGGIGFTSYRSTLRLPDELIPRLRLVGDIFTNALARKRGDEALCIKEQALRQNQESLRQLAAKLLNAQEDERRRIAREMHDDWSQRLAILGIETGKLKKHLGASDAGLPLLRAVQEQLVSLSDDVHALSRQLHPSIIDDLGLVEALRSECASFSRRTEIAVNYFSEKASSHPPPDVALCIYRVVQESLRNIAKHAAAREAWVTLATAGSELRLQIRDQGVGFDLEAPRSQSGLGLYSMEERVRLIQGRLSIESVLGRGTTVEVRVPLGGRNA